jgi:outer membrane lipoprotein carrier protein
MLASRPASGAEAPVHSPALAEYLRQFESSYHEVRTLRAEFTQTYVLGGRTRLESGTVFLARGGKMRWDYQQPKEKIFLSDGKMLLLYIPAENQLTRSSVKTSEDYRVPLRLLLSRFNLSRVFSRVEFADKAWEHDAANQILGAYPKRGFEEYYSEVMMELDPEFNIRRLQVLYPDQSVMEFRFDHLERNVALKPSFFRFAPPAGTEIIDEQ